MFALSGVNGVRLCVCVCVFMCERVSEREREFFACSVWKLINHPQIPLHKCSGVCVLYWTFPSLPYTLFGLWALYLNFAADWMFDGVLSATSSTAHFSMKVGNPMDFEVFLGWRYNWQIYMEVLKYCYLSTVFPLLWPHFGDKSSKTGFLFWVKLRLP